MHFGIREKVALLVMLATAASALLVAQVLTHRATAILREHELVDLGDEASLRGWVIMDKIEGLRDDLINIAFSPSFQEEVAGGRPREDLQVLAKGLCNRYWEDHLRVDLVYFDGEERRTQLIEEKAVIPEDSAWFPESDARAGARLHLSKIQRMVLTRANLPGVESVTRTEPVVWAVAPLDQFGRFTGGRPVYVRIMMTLRQNPSPRHLLVLENMEGEHLVRPDEYDSEKHGNDDVFRNLSKSAELEEALEERASAPITGGSAKVDRLRRMDYVKLNSPYFFREGTPSTELTDALNERDEDEVDAFFTQLVVEVAPLGNVGGTRGGVREIRLLSRSREELKQLEEIVETAFARAFPNVNSQFDWRAVVECDEIHSWAVKLVIGSGDAGSSYLMHYAVLDDELASSIEYEMTTVQNVAFLVAAGFGILGFLIAMHFIRPLRRMTITAQKITETRRESLPKQVASLAQRIDTKRRDEVGDIARASKRLFEELAVFQGELEERVSSRTKELRRANAELEKANDKLKSLSHEKDAFVAKVSHDLRQPLNAIFLQVEALKLSELDAGQKKDVERIHAHAARELNLVNDILEYQKIIMGAERLKKESVGIPQLLEDLRESHEPSASEKGVLFETGHEKEALQLEADERRLRQILGNLVGNACKFTREGKISVEARTREINAEPWIEFTVTDTGRGMSPEEQSKAFVPFVSNKKENAGGSGLGLSICKELVGQMGGRIGFVSELGKGSHFSVFLPVVPTSEHYSAPAESDGQTATALEDDSKPLLLPSEATVLVIDDDQSVRELLRRTLEMEGYKVLTAIDGNQGLEMAENHLPDAITLDVVMPGGKDGWQVLHELKESPRTQAIPVIMVSVMAEHENGLTLDVEDFLVKPIDVNRLSRLIHRVTSKTPQQNLLLVDDDVASLEAMERFLEEAGWQTLKATNGREALDLLSKTLPAAIILDLLMPEMDGFEFLSRLRADAQLKNIPVIVLTGKDPNEEELKFLKERVTKVVKKGRYAASDLIQMIQARIQGSAGQGLP